MSTNMTDLLSALNGLVQIAQKSGDLELNNIVFELQSKLMAIQTDVQEIRGDNEGLKNEITRLLEALKIKGETYFDYGYTWVIDEKNGEPDGPFCSHCWDVGALLVRPLVAIKTTYGKANSLCPECAATTGWMSKKEYLDNWRKEQ